MSIIFAYLDEPPFCAPGPDGPIGCDVEVARAVLRAIGVERVETRLVTFAELLPGVARGAWHINTPLFITAERAELVGFSRPVWSLADGFMVKAGNPKALTSYRALADHPDARLVVVADQVQEQGARAAGLPPSRVLRVPTQAEAVQAVLDGRADAYATVAMAHRGFLRAAPDARLQVVDFGAQGGAAAEGAYSFAKSNDDLRLAFDRELSRYLGSPEHRAIMRRYHFADADVDRVAPRRTQA
ncbi:transporter substrate-binding domain-containing protein [Dongia deserti]|uniref:transporter substrate-binding domain-containing protein n=1 Tax=Dongia deserti TaxID=2268030 RepID=UPI000E655C5D|nr:transporter substrate-binding domain-containing protein [Dongia deserti]